MRKPLKNCSYCTDFSLLKWGVDISCWETCPKLSLEDFYEVMLQSVCVCANDARASLMGASDGRSHPMRWSLLSRGQLLFCTQTPPCLWRNGISTYLKYFKTTFLCSVWQEKSISKTVQICLWTCINYPIRWEISLMTDGV